MNEDALWEAIDFSTWKQIPHIKSKIATEQDVIEGRAVFYINDGQDHQVLDVQIPVLAYQIDGESDSKVLVIVIQAEKVDDTELAGVRYLEGGNGVCTWSELELVNDSTQLSSGMAY
ncbi:hypothetical protein [Flavisolibacter ginsenosidimutans]|uniref:Uncharacterized protein n=1 Tax=Flavisolibacter ginsenosidimutans TaxID=661481 RepID=A0A5B8UNQ9_9BACT|nr:hypothetical protein [Flavisolibacter ginsenosidimutans]QEC58086.1 hypothetical protein FSB75_19975 [Flavisolibacter ginsenosidimutans]